MIRSIQFEQFEQKRMQTERTSALNVAPLQNALDLIRFFSNPAHHLINARVSAVGPL